VMVDRLGTGQFLDQRLVYRHSLWDIYSGKNLAIIGCSVAPKVVCVKKQLTLIRTNTVRWQLHLLTLIQRNV
jgi:hypothetical protein